MTELKNLPLYQLPLALPEASFVDVEAQLIAEEKCNKLYLDYLVIHCI